MKLILDRVFLLKMLFVLVVVNYMIITVIFNDFFVLKYLRDLILGWLLFNCVVNSGFSIKRREVILFVIFLSLIYGATRAPSIVLAFSSFRKYIFPLMVFFVVSRMDFSNEKNQIRISNFLIAFFVIVSFWGIFQAWILGDSFLMKLGYPTTYLYSYGRVMLRNSFYFGGLGIQRVVSTLSNSNQCGLILGSTLLMLLSFYSSIKYKLKNIFLGMILIGYILTFSRSNFLAMLTVTVLIIYPYIPHKKKLFGILFVIMFGIVTLNIVHGGNGLISSLWNWVLQSINFTDSSVAGRSSRWSAALEMSLNNPLGLGFGRVGSIARDAGVEDFLASENSYLAMAIDFGILGMIIYVGFMISLYIRLKKWEQNFKAQGEYQSSRICTYAKAILIYYMIAMFFSNYIHDMEAMVFMYAYVGIAISVIENSKYQFGDSNKMEWEK